MGRVEFRSTDAALLTPGGEEGDRCHSASLGFRYVSVGVGVEFFTFYPNTCQKFNFCPSCHVVSRIFPPFPEVPSMSYPVG